MEIAANYAYTLTANPLSRKCLVLPVMLAVGQEFWNLNEVLQILSVTILEKTHVFQLFSEVRRADEIDPFRNQLTLFDL
jgi:hypothetical protein